MAKHLDDLTDNSFESMRQPVQLLKVNELPDRLMHKEVEVGRKRIDAIFLPKVPNLRTLKTVSAAGYGVGNETGVITTQDLRQKYPRYFIHRPLASTNVREMTDPYNGYTRRQFTDCARTDPTAAPALRKRNSAFLRNGFNLKLRLKAKRSELTGQILTEEEIEMESQAWSQQFAAYLARLDEWCDYREIDLLKKMKTAHYVGTVQGRFITKHFPPLALLEPGMLPETMKVISAEEMGNVIIDRLTEYIVGVRIYSVDEENFTLLPDEFVYVALNDSALTRYERFYGRSDMEPVVQLSRINKHICNIGYAKAFENAYLPKVLAQLPVEGSPEQKIKQLDEYARYMSDGHDVIAIEQSEYGDIQAYPQDVRHEMVVAIRKDIDEIVLGALGSTKSQISRTENLTRDNATIMEIENKRNVVQPDQEIYCRAFEQQLLNPLFAHITGIPQESLPVEVYIEPIEDEEDVLESLDEKKADEGDDEKGPEGRQDSLEDDKDDDIETGALEQKDSTTSLGAAGDWDESAHPRGQPQNAGQFVEKGKGGGSGGEDSPRGLLRRRGKKYDAKTTTLDKVTGASVKGMFDKHRYDVKVSMTGAWHPKEYYQKYAAKLNDMLNNMSDEMAKPIRTVVIKAQSPYAGTWIQSTKELMINMSINEGAWQSGDADANTMGVILDHELGHRKYDNWPLEKMKEWNEKVSKMPPLNNYVNTFSKGEKAYYDYKRMGNRQKRFYYDNEVVVRDPNSGPYEEIRMKRMDAIEFVAKYRKDTGKRLVPGDEVLDGSLKAWPGLEVTDAANGKLRDEVDRLIEGTLNMYSNEQHSALMEYISPYNLERAGMDKETAEDLLKFYREKGYEKFI